MPRTVEAGVYKIKNAKRHTFLSLADDNRTILRLLDPSEFKHKWTVSPRDDNGLQTIKCEAKNLFLAMEVEPTDGTRVVASSAPSTWDIIADLTVRGQYNIKFQWHSGTGNFCLDNGEDEDVRHVYTGR